MIKKMRIRFIVAAMASFIAVILLLMAGINVFNYVQSTGIQDDINLRLMEFEQRGPMPPDNRAPDREFPQMRGIPGAGPESEFTTRFFAVHYKSDGSVFNLSRDFIAAVDNETAVKYADKVLTKNKTKGYYEGYRYLVNTSEEETIVIFLDSNSTIRFMKTLLLLSLIIGAAIILLLFGLIIIFSKQAIQPFVRNIERQNQFITDAGHELKTPLTAITTSADIAAMEHEGDEWIENIQVQTVRLTKLVNDLVSMSRLDEEEPFKVKTHFNLSEAIWEIAEPFTAMARANDNKLELSIQENMQIDGDRDSVQKLVSILLDNAIKYSDSREPIQMSAYTSGRKSIIEVTNSCNLDPELNLNRLFDRFYRAEESHSTATGGTGIGLSMAQSIVEKLGGEIKATRQPNNRISFKATF